MSDGEPGGNRDLWARMRFAVVGPLLAAPPRRGELRVELARLAAKSWRHPVSGESVRFGLSTLERWFYSAHNARRDPVGELRRRLRKDAGCQRSVSSGLRLALQAQYQAHPSWSYQLHTDNLAVLVAEDATLAPMPSYSTVRRYLKAHGLIPDFSGVMTDAGAWG